MDRVECEKMLSVPVLYWDVMVSIYLSKKNLLFLWISVFFLAISFFFSIGHARAALSVDDVHVVFGSGTSPTLLTREWNADSSWSSVESGPTASATVNWVVSALSPTAAEELVLTQASSSATTVRYILHKYTDSSWSFEWATSTPTITNNARRGADVAYEELSGDALVVFVNQGVTQSDYNLYYRARTNGVWSTDTKVFATPPGASTAQWVELVSSPVSDEIALVYADQNEALYYVLWNGSSFDQATKTTLVASYNLSRVDTKSFDAEYETTTGDFMVAWLTNSGISYAARENGTTTFSSGVVQSAGGPNNVYLDVASHPASSSIALVAVLNNGSATSVWGSVWTGSVWTGKTDIDAQSGGPGLGDFNAAVHWLADSDKAILVYEDFGETASTSWAISTSAGIFQLQSDVALGKNGMESVSMLPSTDGELLYVFISDDNRDLWAATYDGLSWTTANGGSPIHTELPVFTAVSYTHVINESYPNVSFEAATSSVGEGSSTLSIRVLASATSSVAMSVQYAVQASSTATGGGTDYTLASGTSTISSGNTSTTISVSIRDDADSESSETIVLRLSVADKAFLGDSTEHVATILDDDSIPKVFFVSSTGVGAEDSGAVSVTLQLSNVTSSDVTAELSGSGTAVYGTDYTFSTSTILISAGATSTTVEILVTNDAADEDDETIVMALSSPTNATLGVTSTHTYTVTDNDDAPFVFFVSSSVSGLESVTSSEIIIGLSSSSGQPIQVQYGVISASSTAAGSGTDYTLSSGSTTIAAGSTTASIFLTIVEDALDEDDETIVITISSSTNGIIGATSTHTYSITDNDASPTVYFLNATSTGSEASGTALLNVSISTSSGRAVYVQYAAVSASSTATGSGTDYTLANGTSTIAAGNTTTSISVSIVNDLTEESDETVLVELSVPTNATLGATTTHTYTIMDDGDDGTVPSISSVTSTPGTTTSTITWETDEAASSQVEYGVLPGSLSASTTEADTGTRVTSHSVSLSGLATCSVYYFRVRGSDAASNVSTSSVSSFTTIGCTSAVPVLSSTSTLAATSTETSITEDTITLTIPEGYSTTTATFQVKKISADTLVAVIGAPSGYSLANSSAYNLKALTGVTTTQSTFDESITITMTYDDSDVTDLEESSLRIFRYSDSAWSELTGCSVNTSTNTVTCTTTSFSDFGLFGSEAEEESNNNNTPASTGGGSPIPSYLARGLKAPAPIEAAQETERQTVQETPKPAVQVSTYRFTQNLKLNDVHPEVKELQIFLNSRGFLISESGPGSRNNETSYFGLLTKQALINFQNQHKGSVLLPVGLSSGTGYFGPSTRNFINRELGMTETAKTSANTNTTNTPTLTKGLRLGDEGEEVRLLQTLLAKDREVYPEAITSGYLWLLWRVNPKSRREIPIKTQHHYRS